MATGKKFSKRAKEGVKMCLKRAKEGIKNFSKRACCTINLQVSKFNTFDGFFYSVTFIFLTNSLLAINF